MDIRTKYDVGCHLYVVNDNCNGGIKIDIVVIVNIKLKSFKGTKCDVCYGYTFVGCGLPEMYAIDIEEKDINKDGKVYDNREQAYQAACKLIDSDIERQLNVIRYSEKV